MIRWLGRSICAGVIATLALVGAGVAQAGTVSDWNVIAQGVTGTLRPTAHGQARGIAMVQGAVYDAVNAIDRGYQPYLLDLDGVAAQPWGSQDAAAATAAHDVLVALAPAQQGMLDAQYAATLAGIPDGLIENEGIRVGQAAATAMLDAREDDGFLAPFDFSLVIGPDPGDWRPVTPTALDPDAWVGYMKPFLIESPSQFRSERPNALTSAAYAEEFAEVKELGALNSATRTADQTTTAIFWQTAPISLWSRMARDLATEHGLGDAELARLLATTFLAGADGAISCWNDKYHWNFWRPITAIREAGADDNPATAPDPAWLPLFDPSVPVSGPALVTPGFPDHPSGHGCVSGAIVHALKAFFRTDKVPFTATSNKCAPAPCPPRSYDRLSRALKEIIDARVWSGIHFRTADVQGAVLGKKVAHQLRKHYFQPLD